MSRVIVDLFCGAGGESSGIHQAMESVNLKAETFAINHWERAIETHAANFPTTEHICRDIHDVDPAKVIKRGRIDLLWASPACTHFSIARGGKPKSDQSRVTAFTVLDWLDSLIVDRVIIENVPEFLSWGPLNSDGKVIQEEKGKTFEAFIIMIQSLGYEVEWRILNAADFGAPTTRRRLFIQAVRMGSKKRILWPRPSHSQSEDLFADDYQPWVPAKEIIDWTIQSEPIHLRKRPLADATMRRIAQGIERFWGVNPKPFLTRYNGGNNRNHSISQPMPVLDTSNRYALIEPLILEYYGNGRCKPVSEPLGTILTKDKFALLQKNGVGVGFRMLQPHELAAAQSFPAEYIFTGNKAEVVKQIGNSVCPEVAKALTHEYMRELA